MGAYVNPEDTTKEIWLLDNATRLQNPDDLDYQKTKSEGKLPVVWVDNGPFTAAIICFSEEEWIYIRGTRERDARPRKYYLADIKDLHSVSDELKDYLQEEENPNKKYDW